VEGESKNPLDCIKDSRKDGRHKGKTVVTTNGVEGEIRISAKRKVSNQRLLAGGKGSLGKGKRRYDL